MRARVALIAANPQMMKPAKKKTAKAVSRIAKLNIPRNEQDRLITAASVAGNDPMQQYACVLTAPKYNKFRVPDAFPRKTALCRSIRTFFPKVLLGTGNTKEGRFACAFQPKFGSNSTTTAQVLSVDPSNITDWDVVGTDWSNLNTYQQVSNKSNLWFDINSSVLASNEAGYYAANSANAGTATNIFGLTGTNVPGDLSLSFNNLNVQPKSYSGQSLFVFPQGLYHVTVICRYYNTADHLGQLVLGASNTTYIPPDSGYTGSFADLQQLNTTNPNQTVVSWQGLMGFQNLTQNTAQWSLTVSAGTVSQVYATIMISPVATGPSPSFGTSNGLVEEIRPVGMSVLATYMGTSLNDGGEIASAYIPFDLFSSNFISNSQNQLGQLQNVETLANLDDSMNGPIKHGTYAWWSPQDETDYELNPINLHNTKQYPVIVIAGTFVPGTTAPVTPTPVYPVRVEVCHVWEYSTQWTAVDTEKCVGSQNMIDIVDNSLRNQPHCMQNATHMEWIKNFINGARGFYSRNEALIKPLAAIAAAALL